MAEVDLTNEQRSQLELLAEEYVDLHRAGNAPSIEQFVSDHPELEVEIRELFPVMLMLDQGKQTGSNIRDHDVHASFSSEIAPGFQLGEYRLLQAIGRGGMGLVYEAEHVLLGNKVAIKLLPTSLNRPKLQERFLREASAAARMNHPNIVRVFDYGKHGRTHYYVMSLVVGVGLDRLLGKNHDAQVATNLAVTRVVSQYRSLVESTVCHSHSELGPNRPTEGAPATEDAVHSASVEHQHPSCHSGGAPATEESVFSDSTSPQIRDDSTASIRSSRYLDSTSVSNSNPARSMTLHRAKSLWEWVAHVGVQAADALNYAHEMGVIHRDVKPSNLMMDLEGKLFVTDFGLAKLANDSSLTDTGDLLGTLRYLPPEALHGRADERGDIYGLGLTLYELLAGEPAFANVERAKLFHDIAHGDIVPLHRKVPKVPHDLAQIIRKSIESDSTLRYADAASMRDDLKRFLSGEPIEARPASISYRISRWIARNRVISVLACLLALVLSGATIAALVSARGFRELAREKSQESQAAVEQSRQAKLNLLASQLSDAGGWSTSIQPGQRVEGLEALRDAIALSRELGVIDFHRSEINETAATLATLNDVQKIADWEVDPSIARIAFRGDGSEYACVAEVERRTVCRVCKAGTGAIVETIDLGLELVRDNLQFSTDGQILSGYYFEQGSFKPWIHNRSTGETFRPATIDSTNFVNRNTTCTLRNSSTVIVLSNENLRLINADSGEIFRTYKLPGDLPWDVMDVAQNGRFAAIASYRKDALLYLDLEDGSCERFSVGQGITQLAVRPDGRQIAIGAKDILIWDSKRKQVVTRIPGTHQHVSELTYNADGRLLLSSGWNPVTVVHDVAANRQILRCSGYLSHDSTHKEQFSLRVGNRVSTFRILSQDTIKAFECAANYSPDFSLVDASTGTLWMSPDWRLQVVDFVQDRQLDRKITRGQSFGYSAIDPHGRDIFTSLDGVVSRMPVRTVDAETRLKKSQRITIGPPTHILDPLKRKACKIIFAPDGESLALTGFPSKCLVRLDRAQDWRVTAHEHCETHAVRVVVHPNQPFMATSSHGQDTAAEVRNTITGEIALRLQNQSVYTRFTPDGKYLIAGYEGRLEKYDVGTWQLACETSAELALDFNLVFSISHDSRWLAVENLQPRGVAILDVATLNLQLLLRSDHLAPESEVGSFDATGRFLTSERGQNVCGIWDLYKLRQHFESLELEWPLPGLGNPTPLRDSNVEIEVIWEAEEPETIKSKAAQPVTRIALGRWGRDWLIAPDHFLQRFEDWTASGKIKWIRKLSAEVVNQIHSFEKKWLAEYSMLDAANSIRTAVSGGVPAFNAEDYKGCSDIYLQLLNQLRSRRIEREDAKLQAIIRETIDNAREAENSKNKDGKPWILRRGINAILNELAALQKTTQ